MTPEVVGLSYCQLRSLRRRGSVPPASGACAIPKCRRSFPRVYDHCHAHDYVRGVLCNWCNGLMAFIDVRISLIITIGHPRVTAAEHAALLAHWRRCPYCAAGGDWRPLYRLTGNLIAKVAAEQAMRDLRESDPRAHDDTCWRAYCEAGSAADPGAVVIAGRWCYRLTEEA